MGEKKILKNVGDLLRILYKYKNALNSDAEISCLIQEVE